MVSAQSGLRQGELLTLRWEDVDLEARTVQVRRTLTRNGGKLTVGPTKTARVDAPSSSLGTLQKRYGTIWSGN